MDANSNPYESPREPGKPPQEPPRGKYPWLGKILGYGSAFLLAVFVVIFAVGAVFAKDELDRTAMMISCAIVSPMVLVLVSVTWILRRIE